MLDTIVKDDVKKLLSDELDRILASENDEVVEVLQETTIDE